MKESKFVKTKMVAGYVLLIAVCVLAVGYLYRVVVRFSAPDSSYALLHSKGFPTLRVGGRMAVPGNQFIAWVEQHTGGSSAA